MIPLLLLMLAAAAPAAQQPTQEQNPTTGRVVATVTTLEGTVQLPGTQVELREQPSGAVLATTLSDGAGHVVFPDVPPGRYTLGAVRSGFVDSASTAFDVRAGDVANVLLDVQLTFTVPTVDVVAKSPSPTDSIQRCR
jgi:hypothetical protein